MSSHIACQVTGNNYVWMEYENYLEGLNFKKLKTSQKNSWLKSLVLSFEFYQVIPTSTIGME